MLGWLQIYICVVICVADVRWRCRHLGDELPRNCFGKTGRFCARDNGTRVRVVENLFVGSCLLTYVLHIYMYMCVQYGTDVQLWSPAPDRPLGSCVASNGFQHNGFG